MKKKVLILLVLAMVLITGCAKIDQGVVINADGGGYLYSKNLVLKDEAEDVNMTNDFLDIEEGLTREEITEVIDGEKYEGVYLEKKFETLDELKSLTEFVLIEQEDDIVTFRIIDEPEEEVTEDDIKMLETMAFLGFEAKFKITVANEIIETNGKVDGDTVVWDLIDLVRNNEHELYVKYRDKSFEEVKEIEVPRVVEVVINGKEIEFPNQKPVVKEGRTLVPVRVISENLDTEVEWIPSDTVKPTRNEKVITLTIGEKEVLVEGKESIELDVPAEIVNDRTMIPLRAVAEIFDMNVEWSQEEYTATISEK